MRMMVEKWEREELPAEHGEHTKKRAGISLLRAGFRHPAACSPTQLRGEGTPATAIPGKTKKPPVSGGLKFQGSG
jgi:hypothetical protein